MSTGPIIKEIYHGMRAKRWLAIAVAVEAFGLIGAIGSIPALGFLPLIWTLAIVGILSTVGVLIVTAHYVWEYNRRPLNDTQRAEIGELLSPYMLSEEATRSLAPKSELSSLVQDFGLFWVWRYQNSIMELAWAVASPFAGRPGHVVVAELAWNGPLIRKAEFALVPPPIESAGECLSDLGEEPPLQFHEWGTLFQRHDMLVFYRGNAGSIKYLRARAGQKVLFDDRLMAPMLASHIGAAAFPELRKINKPNVQSWQERSWEWEWATL